MKGIILYELLNLVLRANGGLVTRNVDGLPTGFFDYSGHTNCVYIRIYPHGWESGCDVDCGRFEFDFDDDEGKLTEKLDKFRAYVDNLLREEDENEHTVSAD